MLKIGLTGGIGSGKSVVGKVLTALGVRVYLSDDAVKRLYDSDAALQHSLKQTFGDDLYLSGKLNKPRLATLIFSNPDNMRKINALVIPAVISDFNRFVASCSGDAPVALESAIIFESGLNGLFDVIINVFAPESLRIQRALARGGNEADIRRRIAAQLSDDEKRRLSDYTLINDDKTPVLPQILDVLAHYDNGFKKINITNTNKQFKT